MQLYTSLVRLKQAMNGGTLPPMTPVPENVRHIIDPAFTPGLGALTEDTDKGLRCPVKGCGRYYQSLGPHLNQTHRDLGGAREIQRVLSLPHTARLESQRRTAARAQVMKEMNERGLSRGAPLTDEHRQRARRVSGQRCGKARRTTGYKNLKDNCDAQLSHKLIDLHHRLGRSPTQDEGIAIYNAGFVKALRAVYGTWANAKAQCGLEVYRQHGRRMTSEGVLDALEAWYQAHGSLPRSMDATARCHRTPLLPNYQIILEKLNADSWPEAMRRAASLLNIYGGRYGLPKRDTAA